MGRRRRAPSGPEEQIGCLAFSSSFKSNSEKGGGGVKGCWGVGVSGSRRLDLLGEDRDVLVEGVRGTDVSAGHSGFPGSAGRQLALLKDQR